MTFAELIEWQWSDYSEKHRNRTNLLIHAVGVPVVWWACIQALGALSLLLLGVPGAFGMLFWACVLIGGSLFVQYRGDLMEAAPPAPFSSNQEFVRRAVAEQFVNFPRFVLSGRFLANLQTAR